LRAEPSHRPTSQAAEPLPRILTIGSCIGRFAKETLDFFEIDPQYSPVQK